MTFDSTIEGRKSDSILVKLDGSPIINGSQVGIGKHQITFGHRKAETVTTNVFVWYGGCDLGDLVLRRNRGRLVLTVDPPAQTLSIAGSEFQAELAHSTGLTSSIPTDTYLISAKWLNHSETNRCMVMSGNDTRLQYRPSLGTLSIVSEPPGAQVIQQNGNELGTTPMTLSELSVGSWKGELRLNAFIPASISLTILPGQTNYFQTNLVNWQYAQAIQEARRLYAAGEYERAFEAVDGALKMNADQGEAKSLRNNITVARYLERGKRLYEESHYADARPEFEAALKIQPENAEIRGLLAMAVQREEDHLAELKKKQEQELAEQTRQKRLGELEMAMLSATREHLDGSLFDAQKLTFTNGIKELGTAVKNALLSKQPAFEIEGFNWTNEQLFTLEAKQPVPGGLRLCLIVGTQIGENQSIIVFRVLEYETHLNVNLGGILRVSDGQPPLVAIPNRKDRVAEGIETLRSRLQMATR